MLCMDSEIFFRIFKVVFGPYFAHVLDAWSKRHHPNLLFLFYEDLKKVLPYSNYFYQEMKSHARELL